MNSIESHDNVQSIHLNCTENSSCSESDLQPPSSESVMKRTCVAKTQIPVTKVPEEIEIPPSDGVNMNSPNNIKEKEKEIPNSDGNLDSASCHSMMSAGIHKYAELNFETPAFVNFMNSVSDDNSGKNVYNYLQRYIRHSCLYCELHQVLQDSYPTTKFEGFVFFSLMTRIEEMGEDIMFKTINHETWRSFLQILPRELGRHAQCCFYFKKLCTVLDVPYYEGLYDQDVCNCTINKFYNLQNPFDQVRCINRWLEHGSGKLSFAMRMQCYREFMKDSWIIARGSDVSIDDFNTFVESLTPLVDRDGFVEPKHWRPYMKKHHLSYRFGAALRLLYFPACLSQAQAIVTLFDTDVLSQTTMPKDISGSSRKIYVSTNRSALFSFLSHLEGLDRDYVKDSKNIIATDITNRVFPQEDLGLGESQRASNLSMCRKCLYDTLMHLQLNALYAFSSLRFANSNGRVPNDRNFKEKELVASLMDNFMNYATGAKIDHQLYAFRSQFLTLLGAHSTSKKEQSKSSPKVKTILNSGQVSESISKIKASNAKTDDEKKENETRINDEINKTIQEWDGLWSCERNSTKDIASLSQGLTEILIYKLHNLRVKPQSTINAHRVHEMTPQLPEVILEADLTEYNRDCLGALFDYSSKTYAVEINFNIVKMVCNQVRNTQTIRSEVMKAIHHQTSTRAYQWLPPNAELSVLAMAACVLLNVPKVNDILAGISSFVDVGRTFISGQPFTHTTEIFAYPRTEIALDVMKALHENLERIANKLPAVHFHTGFQDAELATDVNHDMYETKDVSVDNNYCYMTRISKLSLVASMIERFYKNEQMAFTPEVEAEIDSQYSAFKRNKFELISPETALTHLMQGRNTAEKRKLQKAYDILNECIGNTSDSLIGVQGVERKFEVLNLFTKLEVYEKAGKKLRLIFDPDKLRTLAFTMIFLPYMEATLDSPDPWCPGTIFGDHTIKHCSLEQKKERITRVANSGANFYIQTDWTAFECIMRLVKKYEIRSMIEAVGVRDFFEQVILLSYILTNTDVSKAKSDKLDLVAYVMEMRMSGESNTSSDNTSSNPEITFSLFKVAARRAHVEINIVDYVCEGDDGSMALWVSDPEAFAAALSQVLEECHLSMPFEWSSDPSKIHFCKMRFDTHGNLTTDPYWAISKLVTFIDPMYVTSKKMLNRILVCKAMSGLSIYDYVPIYTNLCRSIIYRFGTQTAEIIDAIEKCPEKLRNWRQIDQFHTITQKFDLTKVKQFISDCKTKFKSISDIFVDEVEKSNPLYSDFIKTNLPRLSAFCTGDSIELSLPEPEDGNQHGEKKLLPDFHDVIKTMNDKIKDAGRAEVVKSLKDYVTAKSDDIELKAGEIKQNVIDYANLVKTRITGVKDKVMKSLPNDMDQACDSAITVYNSAKSVAGHFANYALHKVYGASVTVLFILLLLLKMIGYFLILYGPIVSGCAMILLILAVCFISWNNKTLRLVCQIVLLCLILSPFVSLGLTLYILYTKGMSGLSALRPRQVRRRVHATYNTLKNVCHSLFNFKTNQMEDHNDPTSEEGLSAEDILSTSRSLEELNSPSLHEQFFDRIFGQLHSQGF